jgi:hypothetical protein
MWNRFGAQPKLAGSERDAVRLYQAYRECPDGMGTAFVPVGSSVSHSLLKAAGYDGRLLW